MMEDLESLEDNYCLENTSPDGKTALPKEESFTIETSLPMERMDAFLKTRYPDLSRTALQRLMHHGYILINGQKVFPSVHPHEGDVVTIRWPEPKPLQVLPEDIPLDILYEDEHLIVVNKPAGLCVHPAVGHEEHTLVNALLYHCKDQLSGIGGVARPGIVHRLDMDTSGILIAAKSDQAHQSLSQQFNERSTEKLYLALVCRNDLPEKGKIEVPVDRDPKDRKRMTACKNANQGRYALTTYQVLKRGEYAALVQAQIHTGRTHQIRIHFRHIGYPLVGDATYGERQNARLREQTRYTPKRQMLHAWKMSFTHPTTQERMHIQAPLPEDFLQSVTILIGGYEGFQYPSLS